jgi:hypothetical protein
MPVHSMALNVIVSDHIIAIVPRLSPSICGVGDAAWLLANAWPQSDTKFSFLVVDGAVQSKLELGCKNIYHLGNSASVLYHTLIELNPDGVILHYAARGYHKYGCPFWLLRGIMRWRRIFPRSRFVVYFHELSERLPLKTHHGLISLCDRYIARVLAMSASSIATNSRQHASQLKLITGNDFINHFPVFAHLHEQSTMPAYSFRKCRQFLVFGQPSTQLQVITQFRDYVRRWADSGLLDVLHIVGPLNPHVSASLSNLLIGLSMQPKVIFHGPLSTLEISSLLCSVGFCLSGVTEGNFTKSSSFMAFASRACPTICQERSTLAPLCFTIDPKELPTLDSGDILSKSSDLFYWYSSHASRRAIAQSYYDLWCA